MQGNADRINGGTRKNDTKIANERGRERERQHRSRCEGGGMGNRCEREGDGNQICRWGGWMRNRCKREGDWTISVGRMIGKQIDER